MIKNTFCISAMFMEVKFFSERNQFYPCGLKLNDKGVLVPKDKCCIERVKLNIVII